jgi:integrase/recombinase XerD
MAFCGQRNDELCSLEIPDVDLERRCLELRKCKGNKQRTVPIPARLVGPLRGFIGARTSGPVFASRKGGGHLQPRALQKLVKRLAVAAKLPEAARPRKYTVHGLRHTYATRLLRRGADIVEIKELLGHSSIATTQVYLSAEPERLRAAVERLLP